MAVVDVRHRKNRPPVRPVRSGEGAVPLTRPAAVAVTTSDTHHHELGAANLLLSDLRFALVLLNELRYRGFARLFGVSRDQANLVSLIGLLLVAQKINETVDGVKVGAPSSAEGVLGVVSMREALCGVAGPASRKTPVTGTLLTIAVLLGARPPMKKAVHAVGARAHRASLGFHRRYGWIVDPGHLRQRRAQRRSLGGGSSVASDAVESA